MAEISNIVRTVSIRGESTGVQKLADDLNRVAKAQENVTATAAPMAAAQTKSASGVLSVAKAYEAQLLRLDPTARASAALAREQRLVNLAVAQGAATVTEAAARMDLARAKYIGLTAATHGHTEAVGLNRMQMMELGSVARGAFDAISSGASPLRVLAQESGKLTQALSMGNGGVAGSLRAIGSGLTGILSPTVLIGGALAGIGATAALAFVQWETAQDKLARSLDGIGRRTGLTLDGLNAIAAAGSKAGNISTFAGQGLAAQYAGAGLDPQIIAGLMGTSKKFAAVTGQDLGKAGEELASAFKDPSKGADLLNEKIGFLDGRTRAMIRTMSESGDVFGAQSALLKALAPDLDRAADHTWSLAKAWTGLGDAVDNTLAAIGHGVAKVVDPTLLDQYRQALAALGTPESPAAPGGYFGGTMPSAGRSFFDPTLQQDNQARADDLNEQLRRQSQQALRDAATQRAREATLGGDNVVAGVLPDIANVKKLQDELDALDKAMAADAAGLAHMGVTADQAAKAHDALSRAIETSSDAMKKASETEQNALAGIRARTVAERAAVAEERARIGLEGQKVSPADAAARTAAAGAQVVAEAVRSADDALRSSQDAYSTAGLTGYAKAVADLNQKFARQIEVAGDAADVVAKLTQAHKLDLAVLEHDAKSKPIEDANRAVREQIAGLKVQQATFGQSTGAIAAAIEKQRLLNGYTANSVTVTDEMTRAIDASAAAAGKAAQAQADLADEQSKVIESMDAVRSTSGNFLGTFTDDILAGKSAITGLRDGVKGLLGDLTKRLEKSFLDDLFDRAGTTGQHGIFGGALFAAVGGKKSKVDLSGLAASTLGVANITAGVVNLTGGIGLGGGDGTGSGPAGGIGSTLDALIKNPKKFWAENSGTGIGPVGAVTRGPDLGPVNMDAAAASIKRIESGSFAGNYGAVGRLVTYKNGMTDHALGAYQMMGQNVGPWTKQYLGQRMSQGDFLRDPGAQDSVFRGEFGRLSQRYGPQGAAQAWLGGEGSVGKLSRADGNGTTVGAYGTQFSKYYEQMTAGADKITKAATATVVPVDNVAKSIADTGTAADGATGGLGGFLKALTGIGGGTPSVPTTGGGGGGGLFDFLGSLFGGAPSVAQFHGGGFVGVDGVPRYVHPAHFDHAPRLHSGNLRHDERAAVLQTGELVLSRDHVAAARRGGSSGGDGGQSGPTKVTINNYHGSADANVTTKQGPSGEEIVISIIDRHMGRGGFDRSMGKRYGNDPAGIKR